MLRIAWIVGLGIALVVLAFLTLVLVLGLIRLRPVNLSGYFMLAVCLYLFVLSLKHLLLKIRSE